MKNVIMILTLDAIAGQTRMLNTSLSKIFILQITLVVSSVVCLFGSTQAQDFNWFSTGSTWTYAYQPAFSSEWLQSTLIITGQTQLNGTNCAKMELEQPGSPSIFDCMPFVPAFYFVERNDSVFFATDPYPTFRLGIDFNAEAGGHWYIAVAGANGPDSVRVDVLTRELVEIEGQSLVQLGLNLSNANPETGALEFQNPTIAIEKIGAIQAFFIPFGKYSFCDATAMEILQCFSAGGFGYVNPDFGSCTLGTNGNVASDARMEVYPNPASTTLTLHLPGHTLTHTTLLDMQGRVVQSYFLNNSNACIDLQGLNAGMYIIRAWSVSGVYTQKLIIE